MEPLITLLSAVRYDRKYYDGIWEGAESFPR
jgi:hypothetical protein